jgi:hypothetical protein
MLLVGGGALSGCASTVADLPLIGLPANAPERPKEARAFLPVNDVPQNREGTMTTAEQQKIQADLIAARAASAAAAAAK